MVWTNFVSNNFFLQNIWVQNKIWAQKFLFVPRHFFGVLKNIWSTKMLIPKNLGPKQCWSPKNFGFKKDLRSGKRIWVKNKWRSEKLLGKKKMGSKYFWWVPKAEIMPEWTNVAWTYFPEQMAPWQLASVKEGPRNQPLKFGQNWVSSSWDILNMDKCCQDIFCLDTCHQEGWHLLKIVPGAYL